MGDLSVYVSHDSADVWSNRHLFDLDGDGRPRNVAGVPPDYFSPLGQRWGNPVYCWDILEADGFGWWLGRLEHVLSLFDLVRVDHFRGLIKYWSIPAKEKTAVNGRWVDASPDAFFAKVRETFPEMPFIAENLGVITPDVTAWVERLGVPGMLVLQFAFGDDFEKNPYAPANHIENACVYTGTHDNDTSRGWFETVATTGVKRQIESLAGHEVTPESVSMDMISIAMRSKARMVIIPMQDILGLGTEGRLNTPGTASGNWVWRVDERGLENVPGSFLADLALQNGRLAPSPPGVR
jgi:4-alpha-glucanotransferase